LSKSCSMEAYFKYTLGGESIEEGFQRMQENFPYFYQSLLEGKVKVGPVARRFLEQKGIEIPKNQIEGAYVGELNLKTEDFLKFCKDNPSNEQTTLDSLI